MVNDAIKILIASGRKVAAIPACAGIARRAKERIEIPAGSGAARRIVLVIVVVADRHHVRDFALEQAHSGIGILPLRQAASAIHNVAQSGYQFYVLVLNVIGNPLRLRGKYLGLSRGIELRVRQSDYSELICRRRRWRRRLRPDRT